MYAQFGCGALAASIQVSAQPVAPSLGIVEPIGNFADDSWPTITGQAAPTVASPFLNSETSCGIEAQYAFSSGRWSASSLTAAWNCGWVSSYGSVMPRLGW